jgi:hypothetical protein
MIAFTAWVGMFSHSLKFKTIGFTTFLWQSPYKNVQEINSSCSLYALYIHMGQPFSAWKF